MSSYQSDVAMYGIIPIVILVLIMVLYAVFDENKSASKLVLSLMHSIIPIIGFSFAIVFCDSTSFSNYEPESTIFTSIMALTLVFSILSFFIYKGPKFIHGLLFVVIGCSLYLTLIGGMAISHDWM